LFFYFRFKEKFISGFYSPSDGFPTLRITKFYGVTSNRICILHESRNPVGILYVFGRTAIIAIKCRYVSAQRGPAVYFGPGSARPGPVRSVKFPTQPSPACLSAVLLGPARQVPLTWARSCPFTTQQSN